jgi:sugar-specific transcriptional regulator TrmB
MPTKEEILQDLGLNDKEVKVYLNLLALGQSTVNSISKKARLNRVSCYDILSYLQKKGLASYVIKSGVKYFEAAPPRKFLGDLQEKEAKVKSILPELESLKQSIREKPAIELYEGIAGLKTVLEDVIKEAKESWFISDPVFMDSLEFYFPHFISEKRKIGMFSKVITLDCDKMHNYQRKNPKKYVDIRFIREKLPTTKIIYGNKLAILTFEKENSIGIIIENKDAADTERKLFELMWKSAKT